jgi:hypothetical protein
MKTQINLIRSAAQWLLHISLLFVYLRSNHLFLQNQTLAGCSAPAAGVDERLCQLLFLSEFQTEKLK